MSVELNRNSLEEYKLYTNNIVGMAFRRELLIHIRNFESMCFNQKLDVNELNTKIYETINDVAQKYVCDEGIVLYKDILDEIWGEIVEARNPDGTFGILSKFPSLANYFTYQPGELTLWVARRKMGKSVLAMNELVHKLKNNIPCVYFDTEMNDKLFTTRLLSHLTQIDENKIKAGSYTNSEEFIIEDAKKWIKSKSPLFVHKYNPSWTKDDIYAQAQILKYKINFQFFIYDYIKITNGSIVSSSEQYNELGNWCDFLKNKIGGKLDVPVLTFAQLNRNDNIADSDKIERFATTGIKWRKKTAEEITIDGESCGNYALSVMFNRIGDEMDEDEYVDCVFKKNILTIEECAKQHEKIEPF